MSEEKGEVKKSEPSRRGERAEEETWWTLRKKSEKQRAVFNPSPGRFVGNVTPSRASVIHLKYWTHGQKRKTTQASRKYPSTTRRRTLI